jgi:glycerophosphoryl diester phosphodiesterase
LPTNPLPQNEFGVNVPVFDLQGHRGARGLKPENTLPSFETALDAGVDSIETDVHLTLDGSPVLCHEPQLHEGFCRARSEDVFPRPPERPFISNLTSLQLQAYTADIIVDPKKFSVQDTCVTPLSSLYAEKRGLHPFAIPHLSDLFAFVESYAGEMGESAGKSDEQRIKAQAVQFDLELKRIPFYPQTIGDDFDGSMPSLLERCVLKARKSIRSSPSSKFRSPVHPRLSRRRAVDSGRSLD